MGVFVKICGIATAGDCAAVAALQPDALGFVFWPHSPRAVTPEAVGDWTRDIDSRILRVGVFVDEEPDEVMRVMRRARLDVAQLHGRERIEDFQGIEGRKWKVVHLDRVEMDQVAATHVDAFLIDSYSTASPGGTGQVVDWSMARRFVEAVNSPVLLAGGLRPENVREAIEQVRPWGVDVSSGVEARPGVKDLDGVRRFLEACRS